MLKKGDIILIAAAAALAAAGIGWSIFGRSGGDGMIAVIKQNDKVIRRIDLNKVAKPESIAVTGAYTDTVLVENGRIRFEEADCPDKVCVKTGWLSKRGDTAACLPNRVLIKIEGQQEGVDGGTF